MWYPHLLVVCNFLLVYKETGGKWSVNKSSVYLLRTSSAMDEYGLQERQSTDLGDIISSPPHIVLAVCNFLLVYKETGKKWSVYKSSITGSKAQTLVINPV